MNEVRELINSLRTQINDKLEGIKQVDNDLALLRGTSSIYDNQIQPTYTVLAKNSAEVARLKAKRKAQDDRLEKLDDVDVPVNRRKY